MISFTLLQLNKLGTEIKIRNDVICKYMKPLTTIYDWDNSVVDCYQNTSSPLSLLTACWQCRGLNHRLNSSMSHMAQTERPFFPPLLSNLNPSGFYTFSLCLATTFCLSLVLPSLFGSPLWLARPASCLCQASIKPISCEGCDPPRSYLLPCGLFKKRLKAS